MLHDRMRVFLASPISRSLLCGGLLSGIVVICTVIMLFSPWVDTLTCLLAFGVSDIGATVLRQGYTHGLASVPEAPHAGRHGSNMTHGAVASESTICSGIGRDLLLRGGTAADAMVGTVFCVGVIGMYVNRRYKHHDWYWRLFQPAQAASGMCVSMKRRPGRHLVELSTFVQLSRGVLTTNV